LVYGVHNQIVLGALYKGEELSELDAITKYGTPSLVASVWQLRQSGVKIEKFKDKEGIKRYRLKRAK